MNQETNDEIKRVGELIRTFRKRAKLSQNQLEDLISAAYGSVSRIENGVVNPSKETLQKIIQELKLAPHEATSLYGIGNSSMYDVIQSVSTIYRQPELKSILQAAVNELGKSLNIPGAGIFLVEGDELVLKCITTTWYTDMVFKIWNFNLERVRFNISADNLNAKAFRTQNYQESSDFYDMVKPAANRTIFRRIQNLVRIPYIAAYPLVYQGKSIGLLSFGLYDKGLLADKKQIVIAIADIAAESIAKHIDFPEK